MIRVGIIGGSGLDNPDILKDAKDIELTTPYGKTSSPLKVGKIKGVDVVLLARHGREHTITPTHVNNRANIWALKETGCTHIIASTAVGSLREEIQRKDIVILDQLIDFTKHRHITFHDKFEPHKPAHAAMADPFSEEIRKILIKGCKELDMRHHERGTVVTIEGPRFSTRAESRMFRVWGADVINMSIAPEAILANEAGIPYAVIAMSTDYDCWKEDETPVTWEEILRIFGENVENVTKLLVNAVSKIQNIEKTPPVKQAIVDKYIDQDFEYIKNKIRTIPDWPKPGIMFRDITTLLQDSEGFRKAIDKLYDRYKNKNIDVIAAIESRGFIIGGILAYKLGVSFVPIRKKGKLPYKTVSEEYELEYGTDKIEMHIDAIEDGDNVILIDDLIATGGTAFAACNLIEKLGGNIVEAAFIIGLPELNGIEKLKEKYSVYTLVDFEGE